MKRFICIFALLMMGLDVGFAQRHALPDYQFGGYLIGKGLLRDALTLTTTLPNDYTPAGLDTMRHLSGWVLYHNQNFTSAADNFSKVSATSPLYPKSAFYGTICDLEGGYISGAKERLNTFAATPHASEYGELLAFERGGIALLEGNIEEYEQWQREFSYKTYALAEEQRALDQIALNRPKELSPWVAGVASAIVPGLGKIYAGDVGGGVASFLLVGAFAALTADSWAKAGTPANWRTITYGAVGSLLYVSNIFGSVASVKVYYQNFEEINRQAVMYSIHIPLRNIFK